MSPVAVERSKGSLLFSAGNFQSIFELNRAAFSLHEHKSDSLEREITFISVITNNNCFQGQTVICYEKKIVLPLSFKCLKQDQISVFHMHFSGIFKKIKQ